ncbi:hypothetical protein RMATCC62417_14368 [Rhizopus microsporus]|nr:hypothetical protein RMATCC62417_14368 [Rhizopus microsporus]
MLQAFKTREHYYRKWRKAYGLNKLHFWIRRQETCFRLKRLIHRRRRETWDKFCYIMATGEYTKALAKLSKIRKNRTLKPNFSTPEGAQHSADIMVKRLKSIYSGDLLGNVQAHEIISPTLPLDEECPFDIDLIRDIINYLPAKMTPGVDRLQTEMLKPIQHLLIPALLILFQMRWAWSYVPLPWRIAQVVPIHKEDSPSGPGNYHSISLTTTFRKILKRCIQPKLTTEGPTLDIAQRGFREPRNALDQALCLFEICQILRSQFRITPVLTFLDIKSPYDTVNGSFVWEILS